MKLKSSSGGAAGHPSSSRKGPAPAILPLISLLTFRLHLLHPDHAKLRKLQTGELGLGMNESKLMYVEALRRLSLSEWPHSNYESGTLALSM